MGIINEQLNVLLMPTDQCNMSCIYCFNEDRKKHDKMALETLRKFYDISLPNLKHMTIVWHGGEPLTMGIDFYREAIAMQKEYDNCTVTNRIQTNLTLLNDEWVDFFHDNEIKVGSSFDGTLNDKTRGNSDRILSNSELLKNKDGKVGFISVVSNINIDSLIEDYEFFKKRGLNYTTNLYVAPKDDAENELCLNPEHAISKFVELYEYWLHDKYSAVHLRLFEMYIDFFLFKEKKVCMCTSCLGHWIGIKSNGDIVPCNRYFPDEYSYGSVNDYNDINEAFESNGFRKLLELAIERRKKCHDCEAYEMCAGGCNNVAYNQGGIDNNNGNHCQIFKGLYNYIQESMNCLLESNNLDSINKIVYNKIQKFKE